MFYNREIQYTLNGPFRWWCQTVLPLVYDESLSYYEVLCKVVDYINKLIEQDVIFGEELAAIEGELDKVTEWIENFNTIYAEKVIKDCLATMIFVGINDDGYIVYYIPEEWKDITFNTTGLDIQIDDMEYGRLVLSY